MNGIANQSRPSISPESKTPTMCGCWSRAASLISLEPLGAERRGDFVVQNFERYRTVVPNVVREIDDGEATAT
jgi:hypothetical protein